MQGGVKHYLVQWSDSWVPEHSFDRPDLISKFHERGTAKRLYTEIESEKERKTAKAAKVETAENKVAKGKAGKGNQPTKQPQKETFEVEDIVDEKMEKGKKFYLLKWQG